MIKYLCLEFFSRCLAVLPIRLWNALKSPSNVNVNLNQQMDLVAEVFMNASWILFRHLAMLPPRPRNPLQSRSNVNVKSQTGRLEAIKYLQMLGVLFRRLAVLSPRPWKAPEVPVT